MLKIKCPKCHKLMERDEVDNWWPTGIGVAYCCRECYIRTGYVPLEKEKYLNASTKKKNYKWQRLIIPRKLENGDTLFDHGPEGRSFIITR